MSTIDKYVLYKTISPLSPLLPFTSYVKISLPWKIIPPLLSLDRFVDYFSKFFIYGTAADSKIIRDENDLINR